MVQYKLINTSFKNSINFIFRSFFLFRSLLPAGQRAAFSDETSVEKVSFCND